MGSKTVSFTYKGLQVEVEVYEGATSSGGPDPSSIEHVQITGIELDKTADLEEWLAESDDFCEKVWRELE